jgi:hypothetical protein
VLLCLNSGEFVLQTVARGGGFEDVELNGGGGFVLREQIEPMSDDGVVFGCREQERGRVAWWWCRLHSEHGGGSVMARFGLVGESCFKPS